MRRALGGETKAMSSPHRVHTALVEGEIVIRRPVEEVFDYIADERHEPNFNRRMSRVELLTAVPIGAGSRFGIEMTMMRRVFDIDGRVHRLRTTAAALLDLTRTAPRRQRPATADRRKPQLRARPGRDADALVVARRNAGRNEAACAARGVDGAQAGTTGLEQPEAAPGIAVRQAVRGCPPIADSQA
jgi:hypothetical protein